MILKSLAEKHENHSGTQMKEVTHEENHAWCRTWKDEAGQYDKIDYTLSVPGDKYDEVMAQAKEHAEFKELLRG